MFNAYAAGCPMAKFSNIKQFIYDKIGQDGEIERESHLVQSRYIFRPEMELLLELAGFEIVELCGGYEANTEYDYHNSEVMVFVAQKKIG